MEKLIFKDKENNNIDIGGIYYDTLNNVNNISISYIDDNTIDGGWNAIADNYRYPLWKISRYLVKQ